MREAANSAAERLSKAISMVRIRAAGARGFIVNEDLVIRTRGLCVDGRSIDFGTINGRDQQARMGKFDDIGCPC
jgi:hypothetical protein